MKTKNTAQPKLFIGIDMHKTNWSIRLSTDLFQGKRMTIPADPENLRLKRRWFSHDSNNLMMVNF